MSVAKTKLSRKDIKNTFSGYSTKQSVDENLKASLLEEHLPAVMRKLNAKRNDKKNPVDISLDDALKAELGIEKTGDLFHALGMSATESLSVNVEKLGISSFDASAFKNTLLGHGNFSAQSVTGIDPAYTFLIGELVMRPIRVGMNYSMQSQNWIADQVTVRKAKGEMIVMNFNNTTPKKTKEGASGKKGSVELTTKPYEAVKHKIIFEFTDELIAEQPFNILQNTLQQTIGVGLGKRVDGLAARTLIYGETKNGSNYPEGAGQIGVDTILDGVQHSDVEKVLVHLGQLGYNIDSAILSATTQTNNLFKNQNQMVQYFRQAYQNVNPYNFPLPADLDVLFDAKRAMRKVNYGTITVKQDENIETDTFAVAVTTWAGFVILARDARAVIDRSTDFATKGFPNWMGYNEALFGNPYAW